jgi:hypothetical protein
MTFVNIAISELPAKSLAPDEVCGVTGRTSVMGDSTSSEREIQFAKDLHKKVSDLLCEMLKERGGGRFIQRDV